MDVSVYRNNKKKNYSKIPVLNSYSVEYASLDCMSFGLEKNSLLNNKIQKQQQKIL